MPKSVEGRAGRSRGRSSRPAWRGLLGACRIVQQSCIPAMVTRTTSRGTASASLTLFWSVEPPRSGRRLKSPALIALSLPSRIVAYRKGCFLPNLFILTRGVSGYCQQLRIQRSLRVIAAPTLIARNTIAASALRAGESLGESTLSIGLIELTSLTRVRSPRRNSSQ